MSEAVVKRFKVKRIETRHVRKHISGFGKDAEFEDVFDGHWIVIDAWPPFSLCVSELPPPGKPSPPPPPFAAGDTIEVVIRKPDGKSP